jgi:hypothetical protein
MKLEFFPASSGNVNHVSFPQRINKKCKETESIFDLKGDKPVRCLLLESQLSVTRFVTLVVSSRTFILC